MATDGRFVANHSKTLALVAVGSTLEFYEFQVFGMFTVVIGHLFFAPDMPGWVRSFATFSLLAFAFFFRPVSGALVGHFGDRHGRKKSFALTLLLMAAPTLLIGCLPTYAQIGLAAPLLLMLLRILQGMAGAGEMAGAAVFVTEYLPAKRVGLASGVLYGAIHGGYILAAAISTLVIVLLTPAELMSFGWRIPFILGGLMGFIAVWLRRSLRETPLFAHLAEIRTPAHAKPVRAVLRNFRGQVVLVAGLAGYVGVVVSTAFLYVPTWLQSDQHVSQSVIFKIITAAFLVMSVAAPAWGWLSDRIGVCRALAIGAVGTAALSWGFYLNLDVAVQDPLLLGAWFAGLAFTAGSAGCAFALASSVFPTWLRLSGLGMSYNLGLAIFVGLTPMTLAWLTHTFGSIPIPLYISGACLLGVVVAIASLRFRNYLVTPETEPQSVEPTYNDSKGNQDGLDARLPRSRYAHLNPVQKKEQMR